MKLSQQELKVLVATPSDDLVRRRFHICMVQMLLYYISHPVQGYAHQSVVPLSIRDSILSRARWNAVVEAVRQDATHLLFIDSDQTFPRELIHEWVAHRVDVVAANVATKQIPAQPTARYKPQQGDPGYGRPCYTDDKRGLEKVWRVGTGVMMLRVEALKRMSHGSMFDVKWRDEISRHQGEDWSFAEALEAYGVDMWVDHSMSRRIGHLGEFEYNMDVVGEVVREDTHARHAVGAG